MADTIGIGIIGCGGRINQVTRRTCRQDKRLRVVGVHDITPESVEFTRGFFSHEEYYAHTDQPLKDYATAGALVNDPEIDWVMVGSWNAAHREHVVAAFEAGKHVFCEKPLATTIDDCIAMRDAWRASGKQFVIGFTLRFSPHYRKIKELLDEGIVGDIISMEFNETLDFMHGAWIHDDWRSETRHAGTHLLEKCSHDGGDEVLAVELKECMLNGGLPAAGLVDGLTAAVTCFGIDRALETGQVVDMHPLWDQLKQPREDHPTR